MTAWICYRVSFHDAPLQYTSFKTARHPTLGRPPSLPVRFCQDLTEFHSISSQVAARRFSCTSCTSWQKGSVFPGSGTVLVAGAFLASGTMPAATPRSGSIPQAAPAVRMILDGRDVPARTALKRDRSPAVPTPVMFHHVKATYSAQVNPHGFKIRAAFNAGLQTRDVRDRLPLTVRHGFTYNSDFRACQQVGMTSCKCFDPSDYA